MVSSVIIVIMRPDLIASFALLVRLLVCSEQPQKCRHETLAVGQERQSQCCWSDSSFSCWNTKEISLSTKSIDCSAVDTPRLGRLYRLSLANPRDS